MFFMAYRKAFETNDYMGTEAEEKSNSMMWLLLLLLLRVCMHVVYANDTDDDLSTAKFTKNCSVLITNMHTTHIIENTPP